MMNINDCKLIQGGMGIGVSLGSLAGSVMKENCMGVISFAQPGYNQPDFWTNTFEANQRQLHLEIQKARELSNNKGLLGVNIMVAGNNYEQYVKLANVLKVDAIISGAGLPLQLPEFVSPDILIAPIVSSKKAFDLIVKVWQKRYQRTPDFVVVEGPKAGGHLGFELEHLRSDTTQTLKEIVKEVKESIKGLNQTIPIYAAGGIMNHQDVFDIQEAGAHGVQVASRFIVTYECDAHQNFKEAILRANKQDIRFVKSPSGYPGRGLNTPFVSKMMERDHNLFIKRCVDCLKVCNPQDTIYCITQALINAVQGNVNQGLVFAGERAHELTTMSSVKEVIDDLLGRCQL